MKRLTSFWDGGDVKIGQQYDPKHVSVILYDENDRKEFPDILNCRFDSLVVEKVGINWYTVVYVEGDIKHESSFAVNGVEEIVFKDEPFKVSAKISNMEIDLTNEFEKQFYSETFGYYISWNKFLSVVNSLGLPYNTFFVTAPINTGLNGKYATKWRVFIENKTTLKASIEKTFVEEENEENR